MVVLVSMVYVDRSFFAVSMSAAMCSSVLVAYNMSQCVHTFIF